MNLNVFRKPKLAVLLSSLLLFVSCSQYDDNTAALNTIDAKRLKSMHKNIKINLSNAKVDYKTKQTKSDDEKEADRIFIENVEYLNIYGLEALFVKNNVDTEVISELEFYVKNQNNVDVYQELINNFNIENENEATILFTIFEVQKLVEQELGNSSSKLTISKAQMKSISLGCALAIAGTVGATIGFIGVTGGWGLVYALAMKGLATAALIEACT